jgi:CubicO group peptidase (beta-lactamase class C family)
LFLPSTKIPVASVSKVVTALAAIRILAKHNISLDAGIGGHLPSDWHLNPHVASITFRQLLSHRSGIKDYGNNSQDYATLKKFFTQSVDPTKQTMCQRSRSAGSDQSEQQISLLQ